MTADQISEATAMWFDGFDTLDIAKALGVQESTVYNQLHRLRWLAAKARAA